MQSFFLASNGCQTFGAISMWQVFEAILYQNTPKLDAGLKAKYPYKPRHCL